MQTVAWAESKSRFGWHPRYLIVERATDRIAVLFLTLRVIGLGELWYAPRGPGVRSLPELNELLRQREAFGRAFLVQVEPQIEVQTVNLGGLKDGLRKAKADVQVPATIVVDLRASEGELLASFDRKLRYRIRLAERKGVTVQPMPVNRDTLEQMWELLCETRRRAGFSLRPREYFHTYWSRLAAAGHGQLFFARYRSEIVSGAFVPSLGTKAWYKDGGSTRGHKELGAPHLLQWEVMRWLRARGVTRYDLCDVPRPAALSAEHPWFGLYQFKSRFNRQITEYVGTLELPRSRLRTRAWYLLGERLAANRTVRVHHVPLY